MQAAELQMNATRRETPAIAAAQRLRQQDLIAASEMGQANECTVRACSLIKAVEPISESDVIVLLHTLMCKAERQRGAHMRSLAENLGDLLLTVSDALDEKRRPPTEEETASYYAELKSDARRDEALFGGGA